MKSLILIPCYNTHIYIDKLLIQLRLNTDCKILVYDDGSSPALNIDLKKYGDVFFLRNEDNMGKGYIIKKALDFAKSNKFEYLVTIDGDMQHDPNEIHKFISLNKKYDFILGSRRFSYPMPIHRRLSNRITSFIISALTFKTIKDSQCGYRAYLLNSVNSKDLKENGFLLESELLLWNINKSSKVKNVNIKTIYSGSKSSINNVKDTLNFIKLIFRYVIA